MASSDAPADSNAEADAGMAMPPQPPENHEQWVANTQANMSRARSLTTDVLKRLRANESADALNKEMIEAGQRREKERIKKRVRGRVKEHTEVISGAQRSIREIEEAITQVEGCQSSLVHERYARFAYQKVCERRIELRAKRPQRENFRDAVQEALERERNVLNAARQELLVHEADAQRILTELQEMRVELSRDTGARRLQVESELSQMKQATSALPEVAPQRKEQKGDHPVVKLLSEDETKALLQRSEQVIHNASDLQHKVDRIIAKVRQDSEHAAKRSTKQIASRTRELAMLKRQVEEQLRDVEHAQHQAKQALAKEESKLETIVGEKATQECQSRVTDLTSMVKELTATRRALVEELRCKAAALDVDNSCRRVTPQMASEPKKSALKASASMPNLSRPADLAVGTPTPSGASSSKSMSSTEAIDAESTASTAAPGNGSYLPAIQPKSPAIKSGKCCNGQVLL